MEDGNLMRPSSSSAARLAYSVVYLQKQRYGKSIALSRELLVKRAGNPPYTLSAPHHEFVRDELVAMMESYVWKEELYKEVVQWPATWWDHLKQTLLRRGWFDSRLGRWWIRRHDVRTVAYLVDVSRIYPNLMKESSEDVVKIAVSRKY